VKYLLALILVVTALSASAQLTYQTLRVDYDSAWKYKNLRIIPIRQKGGGGGARGSGDYANTISLSKAIHDGLVAVSERGTASIDNVHWLRINNHSDKPLYVASGEIIAGGRQDRMMARDTILTPNGRDQYVPAMCVEEGRWAEKEKKFNYSNFANSHMRKVLDSTHNQVLIWNEVERQLKEGNFKNKTDAYLSRGLDKKFVQANEDYFNFFLQKFRNTDSTIVGFVCVSGDHVIGSDIFADTHLFYDQLEPLLRGYIDDAVLFGAPVKLPDPQIKKYIDKLLSSEAGQEEFVKKMGKIFRQDGKVIHVNTFVKDQ
jgi:hypothetical protein